jgi:hypothetical protein
VRYTICADCGIDFAKLILSRAGPERRRTAFEARVYGTLGERTICCLAMLSRQRWMYSIYELYTSG